MENPGRNRVWLGVVAFLTAMFMAGCGGSDNAAREFGEFSVPGRQALVLDAGDYGVYYREAGSVEKYDMLAVPSGLDVEVKGMGGASPAHFERVHTGNHVGGDDTTSREIGKLSVPTSGRYLLTVDPYEHADDRASHDPSITIGRSFAAKDGTFTRNFFIGAAVLVLISLGGNKLFVRLRKRRTT